MTKACGRLVLPRALCVLMSIGLAACGGGNEETSVLVVVKNGPAVMRPDQVQIDVYKGGGGEPESLVRAVAAGMDARLGDLVIYPTPGLSNLRIAAFGKAEGQLVSSRIVDVTIEADKQVSVEVVLMAGVPMGDGGVLPADAGSQGDASVGDGDEMGAEVGPADASAPKLDAMVVVPKKATGEACAQGTECQSGSCLQQVCCDKACDGKCNSCKAAGEPVGKCTPVANGTQCGETSCGPGGANKTLTTYQCMSGSCQSQQQSCSCSKQTLMCL